MFRAAQCLVKFGDYEHELQVEKHAHIIPQPAVYCTWHFGCSVFRFWIAFLPCRSHQLMNLFAQRNCSWCVMSHRAQNARRIPSHALYVLLLGKAPVMGRLFSNISKYLRREFLHQCPTLGSYFVARSFPCDSCSSSRIVKCLLKRHCIEVLLRGTESYWCFLLYGTQYCWELL